MTYRLRSMLFMPADDAYKISKGAGLPADAIIADLEDAVAPSRKTEARQTLVQAFHSMPKGGPLPCVRINPVGGPFWPEDLVETFVALPHAYVIPKVESGDELQLVSNRLSLFEDAAGLPEGSVKLIPIIETAAGVLNLAQIVASSPRLIGLAFGAEDFAASVGAKRTAEGWEIFYARSAVVTAAAAFGLPAIDTVFTNLHDEQGLAAECETVSKMGFRGKLAIHPGQVPVINRAFSPTPAEIHAARQLIQAFNAQQDAGRGVFAFEGKMVDMPMIRAAEDVLSRAEESEGG